jgi:hypothetical protein
MSQVIDLCEDSDDDGQWLKTASLPPLPLSRKRTRDNEEYPHDAHRRNENGPGNKTTTGSVEFVAVLEYESDDSSEESLYKAGDWKKKFKELCGYRQKKGHCIFRCHDPEYVELSKWVFSQCCEHRRMMSRKDTFLTPARIKALEGIGFVWNQSRPSWEDRFNELAIFRRIYGHCIVPYNYSGNIQLGNWVATQRYQYRLAQDGETSPMTPARIQELESLGFEWRVCVTAWEDRLIELAEYRKIHGHCNVSKSISKDSKLGEWVANQRSQYRFKLEGKTSHMTLPRIQALEGLGFEWITSRSCWEDRLSELADYCKIHGKCNVPKSMSGNSKLATWVANQRSQYRLYLEGKTTHMTLPRIQALENIGFEWDYTGAAWEDRLDELAEYCKIHGNCNVPKCYSKNSKLASWVASQRRQYKLHLRKMKCPMTIFRIHELESLGFEWDCSSAAWDERLIELTDYHKIQGHCNVPYNYSENSKLASWVASQRSQYKTHLKGKSSPMTLARIQGLESLGFEWKPSISRRQETSKKPSPDDDETCAHEKALESLEHMQPHSLKKISALENSAASKTTSVSKPKNPTGMAESALDAAATVWLVVGYQ